MDAPIINLDQLEPRPVAPRLRPTGAAAARFDFAMAPIAPRLGARKLGYNLTVVPPGRRAFPFHNHHANEEMFLVLAGSGELRIGPGRHPLRTGDIVCCPPGGPETAHQIINTGTDELRYLAVSTMEFPEIAEYPDSGKVLAAAGVPDPATGAAPLRVIARRDESVGYWDGE